MRGPSFLLVVSLTAGFLSGCYAQDVAMLDGTSAAGGVDDTRSPSQIAYLENHEAPDEFSFEGGTLGAPVMLRRETSFSGVSVMLTTPVPEVYYRANTDGVWMRLQAGESSGEHFHAGYISLLIPTQAIELWSPYPLSFARLEFHSTATGQALPMDDEPGYADEIDGLPSEHDETEVESGSRQQALARPGRWMLSSAARAASDRQYVRYESPPAWNGGRACTGGLKPGTQALGEHLVRSFKGARYFGGYACRRIVGGSGTSVHAVGRAIDLFVPLDRGQADNDLGDEIANYLVEHAQELGVQFIIWDRTKWNASYSSPKDRYYGGQHPHHDHLHIELTAAAASGARSYPGTAATPPPIVFTPPFADDDDNTHVAAIEAIYRAGITVGCGNDPLRYCPRQEMSRGNAAVMLQRALRFPPVPGDYFDDDNGLPTEGAINALAARDILTGCEAGKVCPTAVLTRGALAVMLARALELPDTTQDYFSDDTATFYEAAANKLAAAGLTQGCSTQSYCGSAPVHRDEFASFIARVVGLLPGFSAQPIAFRGHFADDDGHLFEAAIDAVADAGIVNGCAQGATPRYCPDDAASRAQMASILVRAFALPPSNINAFDDDEGNTHESAINALAASGITAGCGTRTFCPQRPVSRGEVAVFIQRAARLPATSTDFFDDDDGKFYEDAVNRLAAAGITNGCGTRQYCGDRATNRGEVAAFISRSLGL